MKFQKPTDQPQAAPHMEMQEWTLLLAPVSSALGVLGARVSTEDCGT